MGLIGQDLVTLKATDGTRSYDLPLAVGDHVRLFRNTRAAGFGRGGSIGCNQSVLEVVGISGEGITMKTAKGRVALVHLEATRRRAGNYFLTPQPSFEACSMFQCSLTLRAARSAILLLGSFLEVLQAIRRLLTPP
jgi:hypothetical protein